MDGLKPRVAVIPYKPRPLQLEFHNQAKRFNLLFTHRRFGKTVMGINHYIRDAMNNCKERPQYAYVHPFRNEAKDIAWDYLKHYTASLPGVKYNESDLNAILPNGAKFFLFGCDRKPNAGRGMYFDGVILDEAQLIRPGYFTKVILPALADRQGSVIITGTPEPASFLHEQLLKAETDSEWFAKIYSVNDTDVIPREELARMQRNMSPEEWAQEFLCSFDAGVQGGYYGKYITDAKESGRIADYAYNPDYPVWTAWDLGRTDSTVIWFFQKIQGKRVFIDYYENSEEALPHYIKYVKAKPYRYAHHIGPHDLLHGNFHSNQTSYTLANQLGLHFRVCPNIPINEGIESVWRIIDKCYFDATKCKDGIDALKAYKRDWDDVRKVWKDKPRHDWSSHASDAFRYFAVYDNNSSDNKPDATLPIDTQPKMSDIWEAHFMTESNRRNSDKLSRI